MWHSTQLQPISKQQAFMFIFPNKKNHVVFYHVCMLVIVFTGSSAAALQKAEQAVKLRVIDMEMIHHLVYNIGVNWQVTPLHQMQTAPDTLHQRTQNRLESVIVSLKACYSEQMLHSILTHSTCLHCCTNQLHRYGKFAMMHPVQRWLLQTIFFYKFQLILYILGVNSA